MQRLIVYRLNTSGTVKLRLSHDILNIGLRSFFKNYNMAIIAMVHNNITNEFEV